MNDQTWQRQAPALPDISFQSLSMSVYEIVHGRESGNFAVDAPYQRGSVWSDDQRRNLIRSLVMNIPIGAIYQARFDVPQRGAYGRIVDGKQRIVAIWAFVDDEFGVPADWFDDNQIDPTAVDGGGFVRWSGLTDLGRRVFTMRPTAVLAFKSDLELTEVEPGTGTNGSDKQYAWRRRTPDQTIAYEAMVYGLVNSTGSTQTDFNLANAARYAEGGW